MISSWPAAVTLQDGYQIYAKSNPFLDPLHPAGYSLLLAAIGAITHRIAVNAKFGVRFGVEPTPAWYLYGRVGAVRAGRAVVAERTFTYQHLFGSLYRPQRRSRVGGGGDRDRRALATVDGAQARAQIA
jgi:hypothetical protein